MASNSPSSATLSPWLPVPLRWRRRDYLGEFHLFSRGLDRHNGRLLQFDNDNAPRLGAAVAFYTLLSLAPVIVIAVAVAAAIYGQDAAQGRLSAEIQGIAGPDVARTIQVIIVRAYQPETGLIATLLGLATLAFGASSVFVELHESGVFRFPSIEAMPPLSYV